jgi:hypothetical protein
MAEEDLDEVTFTVRITVTLTVPPPETQQPTVDANAETVPSIGDEVARATGAFVETASLNDGEGSINCNDDDVVAKDSVHRRKKRAALSWRDVEGDDRAAVIYFNRRRRRAIRRRPRKNLNKSGNEPSGDSVSVEITGKRGSKRKSVVSSSSEEDDGSKINNAPKVMNDRNKKKRGRKSFAEIQQKMIEETDGEDEVTSRGIECQAPQFNKKRNSKVKSHDLFAQLFFVSIWRYK